MTDEYVAAAYGDAMLGLAEREPRLVVLDADLASDCRVRGFELAHPDRFFETGIAEQDMVSAAAGPRPAGTSPGGQLLRQLPRLARERADLQPGERGHESRLRPPLRGSDPRRAGQVAPEPPRRLAARRHPGRHGRPPRDRRGDSGNRRLGRARRPRRRWRSGSPSDPRRDAWSFRATPSRLGAAPSCGTAPTRCCSHTAPSCCTRR